MKNHGKWVQYKPIKPPMGAPLNALYWNNGIQDWYDFSRKNWNVVGGVDSSGTYKIVIYDNRVLCLSTDVTMLNLPTTFQLLELDIGDSIPKLGMYYNGSGFSEKNYFQSAEERRNNLKNISAKQFWLMVKEIGIKKSDVLFLLNTLTNDASETLRIEITEPSFTGFQRTSPAIETFITLYGIPEDQFDDLWEWSYEIN